MDGRLPIWVLVVLCGAAAQLLKFLLYTARERRPALHVLGESIGLPSLHAAVLTCLTVLLGARLGWSATVTAVSLVFSVLVVHDTIRLKGASQKQRVVLRRLVAATAPEGRFQAQLADLLHDRWHRPLHVAIGVLFGLSFALVVS
jgi:acid phosphatase family membrane protein YuiD